MAKVTGHLYEPQLRPCPHRDDVLQLKDDACNPVRCTRKPDWTGKDCCQFWKSSPNMWGNDVVHVDQFNPERFDYNNFRYQLFAKPAEPHGEELVTERRYIQPNTDIRALKQTFYIPVLPTKPGGITDVTFPMTPDTLGQPDVTTACCVPVIPCTPGYENLTSGIYPDARALCQGAKPFTSKIYPDARTICQSDERCKFPQKFSSKRVDICSEIAEANKPIPHEAVAPHPIPPQFMVPPSNRMGAGCMGLPDTFPQPRQLYAAPEVPGGYPPQYSGQPQPQQQQQIPAGIASDVYCRGDMAGDGLGGDNNTSVRSVRYEDRVARDIAARAETREEWGRRLSSMYGAYGAHLLSRPTRRRFLAGNKNFISEQGHGFHWQYPKYENNMCYTLERNPRC